MTMEEEEPRYMRSYADLEPGERAKLKAMTSYLDIDPATTEYLDEWTDDHIVCVGGRVNGIELGFWCVGAGFAGTMEYAKESEQARKDLFDQLFIEIKNGEEELEDRRKEEAGE